MPFYHNGQRALQAQFDSTALADRLEQRVRHDRFTEADKSFIEAQAFFFLATADAEGRPDCSHKGGAPGFVRVAAPDLLIFPDYDGNGMFRSLGNISVNPHVGLLFIAMGESPKRLRVNGRARVEFDDPLTRDFVGAQALVRVTPDDIFPNCPRYIHDLEHERLSKFTPTAEQAPLEPSWKSSEDFRDVIPPRKA
ncbi:MAG TPA: pyridoxamine 5'-phosphate oxidase family protein [Caulobacterales bacterium]|nr:pyridoxamine 5'-phosphate oxidase family protein [Caulobacterales bacterium]